MQTPACANHTDKQTFLCRKRSSSGMDPHRANTDGITAKSNVCAAPGLGPPLQCSWFSVRPPERCPPQAGAVNPPPGHPRPSTAPPSSCRCCRPVPPRSRAPALCRWSTRWLCALWDQPNCRELSSVLTLLRVFQKVGFSPGHAITEWKSHLFANQEKHLYVLLSNCTAPNAPKVFWFELLTMCAVPGFSSVHSSVLSPQHAVLQQ